MIKLISLLLVFAFTFNAAADDYRPVVRGLVNKGGYSKQEERIRKNKIKTAKNNVADIKRSISEIKTTLPALEKQLKEMKYYLDVRMKRVPSDKHSDDKDIADLSAKTAGLEKEIADKKRQLKDLAKDLEEAEKKLDKALTPKSS
ncbi:MAG: hypothetical protein LBP75_01620 [Planctomycetota bacterium]|jgi:predicted RNase H-like nuclease (RuvC/YqgF family)|nr:hypothetical protein [Planctomycetota bacterium]